MLALSAYRVPVAIVSKVPGGVGHYGDEEFTTESVLTAGVLQQKNRSEVGGHEDFSRTDWELYLPADAVVPDNATIVAEGKEFEVVGDPWLVKGAFGKPSHVECTLRRLGAPEA